MNILIFNSSTEDYLCDSILIGFRQIFGARCVDYPKSEILYKNSSLNALKQVRGKGFTLYSGILDDIEIDRFNIEEKIKSGFYTLIVIGDIQRQYGWFIQFRPWLNIKNTIILDGSDTPYPYPARGHWLRRPYYWFLPKAHKKFLYFKREWHPETRFNIIMRLFPRKLLSLFPQQKNLRKISFSIPVQKIVDALPSKTKDFTTHIVDEEAAMNIAGTNKFYAFDTENDYYSDLQDSRFGITTRRAGWDCLRHYEIAANGSVICFRDLDQKPLTSAPHGLLDGVNCISYRNYQELLKKINGLTPHQYNHIQVNSLQWAKNNCCTKIVELILQEFKKNVN